MQARNPNTDNVDLKVKALRCDSIEAQMLTRSKNDSNWFNNNCIRLNSKNDERPVVYVNKNNFYFNITK